MSEQAFNDWYDRYLNEAIEKYAGLDTTNPKGIAQDAWQAAIEADRKRRGEPVACFKCGHAKHGGECVNVAPQPVEPDDPNTSPRSGKGPFESASDLINSINEPVKVPSDAISVVGVPEFDALMDHIYENGTASEGVLPLANAFARALLARYGHPAEPEGWQLVPKEPTEEMLAATSWPNCAGTDYKHMLSSAPKFGEEE